MNALNPEPEQAEEEGMTTTFLLTVLASDVQTAIEKINKHADRAGIDELDAFAWARIRDERHGLIEVRCSLKPGADRNHAWVILTSYGMSPTHELGADWQDVPGVGQ